MLIALRTVTDVPGRLRGDNGPATAAYIADPRRMTFGPDGAIYFAESKNHVIRRVRTDGVIETFAGTGQRGYGGDKGPARQATFNAPYDIVFSPNGDAYIADTNNNAIRRIDTTGMITTVVGNGDAGLRRRPRTR
jgi:streptogramin lyase